MASANVKNLTDQDFTAVVESGAPVLIDFWAEWCPPCKKIGPMIDELADEFSGKLTVGKIDIETHQGAANQFGVQSIPTLMIFKEGKLAERIVGAQPKEVLVAAINRVI